MVNLYKQWAISIFSSSEDAWIFYVRSPEGDLLSNHQSFDSPHLALSAAQRHVDNHVMLDEVIGILDPLAASNAIGSEEYVRCIEIFRTLANHSPECDETA